MEPLESAAGQAEKEFLNLLKPPEKAAREFILNGCTYGELYRIAAGIRRLSSSFGEGTICLCTEDRALVMAAVLSSLSGGPRVVLPYAFSRQALGEVHESLPVSFFLADGHGSGDFPAGPAVVTVPELAGGAELPLTARRPDDPFLFLFTGGSTGTPKTWPKTPRNLFAEAGFHAESMGISPDDVFLSTAPSYHIYGLLFSVLVPFAGRARVLNETHVFPQQIVRSLRQFQASVLVSVPPHYRVLKSDELKFALLRIALSSAGVLDKADADSFRERTGVDITEVFGSTETGGIATRRRLRDGGSWVPIAPVDWKIVDGRLQVRSDYLSPSLPRDREGFFTTADCVDADSGGRFLLRGRADGIVKIGGKRVDVESVRSKMKQIPGVRDAVVLSMPAGKGRQNELRALAAADLSAAELKRELAKISEGYALPRKLVIVDEIPVTPTGKYDRAEIEKILNARRDED